MNLIKICMFVIKIGRGNKIPKKYTAEVTQTKRETYMFGSQCNISFFFSLSLSLSVFNPIVYLNT